MSVTGNDNYFEDFRVGATYRHARGKTVTEMDNVLITNLVMNTAQAHFNEDLMSQSPFHKRIVFGGITASMILGLAMQDTGENALRELGLSEIRLRAPVFHGDTLYACSEVLKTSETGHPDAGEVLFRHQGFNQDGKVVFEGERRVLIKKRGH